ncbi:hypothetical protein ACVIKP_005072 [Rhizobium leguminosarum]
MPPSISRGGRSLNDDIFAGPAAVLRAANDQYPELGRNDVELLADVFAYPMQIMSTAWAGMVIDINQHLNTWQMGWQRTPVCSPFGNACLAQRGRYFFLRFKPIRLDLFGFLQAQEKLILGKRFRASAEAMALQFLDDLT